MMRRKPVAHLRPPIFALLITALVFSLHNAAGEEIRLPIAVAAKAISPAPAIEPQQLDMRQPQQRAEPTLPDARLPQYELRYGKRRTLTDDQRQSGTLYLQLALPGTSLLIEAGVHIDGKPFPHARGRRVEELLTAIASQEAQTHRRAANQAEKIRRYVAATGELANEDELQWLLTHWLLGPELLLLNHNFQKFRADERPLFRVLDRNGDGAIDGDELEQASDALSRCDFNGDGIVDALEIMRAARALPSPVVTDPIDGFQRVLTLLPQVNTPPDITLAIAFDSQQPQHSHLTLVAVAGSVEADTSTVSITPQDITLRIGNRPVSFSMVQLDSADRVSSTDQISLGCVIDGYPLIPELDPNHDGRFTVRELRSLTPRLRRLDTDHDGMVTMDETAATTRICFGLGPIVHRELANLRDVPGDVPSDAVQGPDWFTRMDRNNDNDLTRAEFLGTDEQFDTLDRDGDGLISASEAIQFEQGAMPESQKH